MKRAHCVIVRAGSWLTGNAGALMTGLAVVWMASAPRPAWGQSSWYNYPNNTAISVTSGGNVGIGTTNPEVPLHVYRPTTDALLSIQTGNLPHYAAGLFLVSNKRWLICSQGDWMYTNGALLFRNNTDGINAMTITAAGSVGIGTTSPQYKLAVNGTIGAKEVIVTNTGWSDYVFRPGYRLRPLSEVNAYIQAHRHLPDIPSEAEVKEKGVSVGDMQSKLLAKIEELTLHMIQQDKENRELRERIARLETRAAGR
jgi:hypothetical protein